MTDTDFLLNEASISGLDSARTQLDQMTVLQDVSQVNLYARQYGLVDDFSGADQTAAAGALTRGGLPNDQGVAVNSVPFSNLHLPAQSDQNFLSPDLRHRYSENNSAANGIDRVRDVLSANHSADSFNTNLIQFQNLNADTALLTNRLDFTELRQNINGVNTPNLFGLNSPANGPANPTPSNNSPIPADPPVSGPANPLPPTVGPVDPVPPIEPGVPTPPVGGPGDPNPPTGPHFPPIPPVFPPHDPNPPTGGPGNPNPPIIPGLPPIPPLLPPHGPNPPTRGPTDPADPTNPHPPTSGVGPLVITDNTITLGGDNLNLTDHTFTTTDLNNDLDLTTNTGTDNHIQLGNLPVDLSTHLVADIDNPLTGGIETTTIHYNLHLQAGDTTVIDAPVNIALLTPAEILAINTTITTPIGSIPVDIHTPEALNPLVQQLGAVVTQIDSIPILQNILTNAGETLGPAEVVRETGPLIATSDAVATDLGTHLFQILNPVPAENGVVQLAHDVTTSLGCDVDTNGLLQPLLPPLNSELAATETNTNALVGVVLNDLNGLTSPADCGCSPETLVENVITTVISTVADPNYLAAINPVLGPILTQLPNAPNGDSSLITGDITATPIGIIAANILPGLPNIVTVNDGTFGNPAMPAESGLINANLLGQPIDNISAVIVPNAPTLVTIDDGLFHQPVASAESGLISVDLAGAPVDSLAASIIPNAPTLIDANAGLFNHAAAPVADGLVNADLAGTPLADLSAVIIPGAPTLIDVNSGIIGNASQPTETGLITANLTDNLPLATAALTIASALPNILAIAADNTLPINQQGQLQDGNLAPDVTVLGHDLILPNIPLPLISSGEEVSNQIADLHNNLNDQINSGLAALPNTIENIVDQLSPLGPASGNANLITTDIATPFIPVDVNLIPSNINLINIDSNVLANPAAPLTVQADVLGHTVIAVDPTNLPNIAHEIPQDTASAINILADHANTLIIGDVNNIWADVNTTAAGLTVNAANIGAGVENTTQTITANIIGGAENITVTAANIPAATVNAATPVVITIAQLADGITGNIVHMVADIPPAIGSITTPVAETVVTVAANLPADIHNASAHTISTAGNIITPVADYAVAPIGNLPAEISTTTANIVSNVESTASNALIIGHNVQNTVAPSAENIIHNTISTTDQLHSNAAAIIAPVVDHTVATATALPAAITPVITTVVAETVNHAIALPATITQSVNSTVISTESILHNVTGLAGNIITAAADQTSHIVPTIVDATSAVTSNTVSNVSAIAAATSGNLAATADTVSHSLGAAANNIVPAAQTAVETGTQTIAALAANIAHTAAAIVPPVVATAPVVATLALHTTSDTLNIVSQTAATTTNHATDLANTTASNLTVAGQEVGTLVTQAIASNTTSSWNHLVDTSTSTATTAHTADVTSAVLTTSANWVDTTTHSVGADIASVSHAAVTTTADVTSAAAHAVSSTVTPITAAAAHITSAVTAAATHTSTAAAVAIKTGLFGH